MPEARARPEIEAINALATIQARLRARMERALPPDVSAASFEAMERLSRADAPTGPAELADALGLSRAALSNTLARLEGAGWVLAVADPQDGRRKRLWLTPKGVETYRDCLRATRPDRERLRDAVSPWAAEAALPFLRSLEAWLTRS